jgi:hypothetical protein
MKNTFPIFATFVLSASSRSLKNSLGPFSLREKDRMRGSRINELRPFTPLTLSLRNVLPAFLTDYIPIVVSLGEREPLA